MSNCNVSLKHQTLTSIIFGEPEHEATLWSSTLQIKVLFRLVPLVALAKEFCLFVHYLDKLVDILKLFTFPLLQVFAVDEVYDGLVGESRLHSPRLLYR